MASGPGAHVWDRRVEDALRQLSWRFGHWKSARTGILDSFFHRFADEAEGRVPFLEWVERDYEEVKLKQDFVANGLASFVTDQLLKRE